MAAFALARIQDAGQMASLCVLADFAQELGRIHQAKVRTEMSELQAARAVAGAADAGEKGADAAGDSRRKDKPDENQ